MNDLSILNMEVNLNSESYSLDLSEDMLINAANISESYQDQPSKYAWWATLATLARSKATKLKQQIDRENDYIKTTLTGVIDTRVREDLEMKGEKVTETKVTNLIYVDPEYLAHKSKVSQLQDEFLEADEQARMLEIGKETMNQRKEMLISLGAQLRMDYDGVSDFSIKSQNDDTSNRVSDIVGKKRAARAANTKRKPVIISE